MRRISWMNEIIQNCANNFMFLNIYKKEAYFVNLNIVSKEKKYLAVIICKIIFYFKNTHDYKM